MPQVGLIDEELLTSSDEIKGSKKAFERLKNTYVHNNIAFYYLDWLIRKSPEISDIIRQRNNETSIMSSSSSNVYLYKSRKGRLLQLLNDENLIKLEEKFPTILHIEDMMDATRFYLYRKYSNPKLGTKESEEVELRIVVPLMLHKIFDRLMNIKSKHVNYDKEIEDRIQTFKNIIMNVNTNEKICTPRAVCLILNFSKYIKDVEQIGSEKYLDKFLNWKHEKICHETSQLDKALEQQRKSMTEEHENFLDKKVADTDNKYSQLFKVEISIYPGSSTKMAKLIPHYRSMGDVQPDDCRTIL
uniref:Uncharacterized protein n=1 Tax=Meloidogyne incognita TaxID=6306 RepID=A0A914NTS5_MELIC